MLHYTLKDTIILVPLVLPIALFGAFYIVKLFKPDFGHVKGGSDAI